MSERPMIRAAAFDFTGCEGCQLNISNLETRLAELLAHITFVTFRLISSSEDDGPVDIAFVEGAITTEADLPRLRAIRERAKLVVAIGACAHLGGINRMVDARTIDEARNGAFGSRIASLKPFAPRPLEAFIKVDAVLPGCPIDRAEIMRVVGDLIASRRPRIPDHAVCVECRQAAQGCLLDKGVMCLGMVTRGGCDAVCTRVHASCRGCRGTIPGGNVLAMASILERNGHEPRAVAALINEFLDPQYGSNAEGEHV